MASNTSTDNTDSEIDHLLYEKSEKLGTIGSPSSTTKLELNIMEDAVRKKLIGELAIFNYIQDNKPHYVLGQITEITLKNNLLENSTIQSLARLKGSVNQISEIQDVHIGSFLCSAVFSHDQTTFEPSILGTVPSTGTSVFQVSDSILDKILEKYLEKLFYLGYSYGAKTKLPMWFKHFGHGIGGAGEAYHLGIFGATGSGKSTLAQMILMAYSKYSQMGLLILDPVGEFTKNMKEDNQNLNNSFNLNFKQILDSTGKELIIKNVRELVLDRWNLFQEILYESPFFNRLTIWKGQNRYNARDLIINKLRNKKKIILSNLAKESSFDFVMQELEKEENQQLIFSGKEQRERLMNIILTVDKKELYMDIWKPICTLFENRPGAIKIDNLLSNFYKENNKPMIIIDLSFQDTQNIKLDYWSENIKTLILTRILRGLTDLGEKSWHKNQSLNTLAVLDEAHRFAGKRHENERMQNQYIDELRSRLLDAVRTTRKYGLGWMFISTSLSSIDRDILQQLRITFYGFGLSMGSDLLILRELVADNNAIDLYRSFTDPASAFDTKSKRFSFMSRGPVSPLSFAGVPLFFNAFSAQDFADKNKLR